MNDVIKAAIGGFNDCYKKGLIQGRKEGSAQLDEALDFLMKCLYRDCVDMKHRDDLRDFLQKYNRGEGKSPLRDRD